MTNPRFKISFLLLALPALLIGGAVTFTPAYAAGIIVNSNGDTPIAGDEECILREAINNANSDSDTTSGDCAAGVGADVITFDSNYIITLIGSQLPSVTTTITIMGKGAEETIIQANADAETATYRIFEVANTGDLSLDGLTIQNGHCIGSCETSNTYGGGILNNGTLAVTNSIFSHNRAGYGGGIQNNQVMSVVNSTFSYNTSAAGGGISSWGSANIMNSTFLINSSNMGGAAIDNSGSGEMNVTNSTFSGNNANGASAGGIQNLYASLTVTNSTFSANPGQSGGIYNNNGGLTINNSILANSFVDCINDNGSIDGTNNLIETDGSGGNACGTTDAINSDPGLGSLADNGGPTQTFALLSGSPAIDAGDNTICDENPGPNNLDQRGKVRPAGTYCDIGAYEAPTTYIVTKTADTDDDVCDSDCSLREAIVNASFGDTIVFDASLSGQTITLSSQLEILEDMTIDGSSLASKITISGDDAMRVFYVGSGVTATLDSLIVTQGQVEGCCGAGLLNYGTLTITNSLFSANNNNNGIGGAIMNDGGTLTVRGSTISGNTASSGGGIGNNNQMTITNSTFSANTSGDAGAGIYNDAGVGLYNNGATPTLTVTNSTFSGNSASTNGFGSGGGIFSSGSLTVRNSTFSSNSAAFDAGGIAQDDQVGGMLNISNTIIANSLVVDTSSEIDCRSQSAIGINTNNLVEHGGHNCSSTLNVDPKLGPLADNGGSTQTFALLAESPAMDAGNDATCAASPVNNLDQRGATRPNSVHCDIGAYEHIDTTAPNVTAFTVPASPTRLNIPITTFTASDDAILTGYLITESTTPPTLGNSGWTASAPTTYPVASMGTYTLYPWAKDAAGHVSAVYGSPATVNITCLTPITVTSSADSGAGTLRQALTDACVGDINNISIIDFNSSLSGSTIHLATELLIDKNVTIDGSNLTETITISGDDTVRVFNIPTIPLNTRIITLDSLIVTEGATNGHGAGLYMGQGMHVTITNSTFSNNHAVGRGGGILNQGSLTLIDSTISGNSANEAGGGGGGISNESGLTMTNSTISDNHATGGGASGGGLFNTGSATITNSTITENSTTTYGGGIYTTANLTITNSTISDNSADITGGLQIDGNVTHLRNTIIANNSSTTVNSLLHSDCSDTSDYPSQPTPDGDGIMTNVNNLIEDGSCSPSLSGDPKLGPLANNGGPTQTLAILAGSPAMDAGNDTTCAAAAVNNLDQRGETRPSGPHCDIGSYEVMYTDIDVIIGGNPLGTYTLAPGSSERQNYPTIDAGPVVVKSNNSTNIVVALREMWNNQATGQVPSTSFAQLMGIPEEQLSDTYYLPHYNDLSPYLDAQLRFGNVDSFPTEVTVTIGGVDYGPYPLEPNESLRMNYPTVDAGPVVVKSNNTAKIVVALREMWNNQGTGTVGSTSFTQIMGIPKEQLSDTYYLPHYNDLSPYLDAQLRFGNVDSFPTEVTVTIGDVDYGPYPLEPNESFRINYPTVDAGPVVVKSNNTAKIVVALREMWNSQGTGTVGSTSFAQLMGIPLGQLSDTYVLPHYNDVSPYLDAQMRFGNVDSFPTEVTVTIGGVDYGPYDLDPNESFRINYPTVDAGPVVVQSNNTANIVVALREMWNNKGTGTVASTSFTQIMGIPFEALSDTYYLPHYNDVSPYLDAQLRFGVP